jgi:hypothetical protein
MTDNIFRDRKQRIQLEACNYTKIECDRIEELIVEL